jgi:23S rRNA pseudouridine2605 synthase
VNRQQPESERLQKLLAAAGLGSRRLVEEWIRAGRLSVNGQTAKLGDRASGADDIRLDGRRLELGGKQSGKHDLLIYHKPLGEVTTRRDPQGRPTVFERLPPTRGRWIVIGRLDVNTSGLMLFTTDGELAHRMMHPSSGIEREYLVRVKGRPDEDVIGRLLTGVMLEDGPASFDRLVAHSSSNTYNNAHGPDGGKHRPAKDQGGAEAEGHSWFRVVLHEGRNREVRRLWSAVGFEVSRLTRIRYGPVELPPDMRPGTWRLAEPALMKRVAASLSHE